MKTKVIDKKAQTINLIYKNQRQYPANYGSGWVTDHIL